MAIELKFGNSVDILSGDSYMSSSRFSLVPRGAGYSIVAVTGVISAGLAAGSTVFAMRNSPTASKNVLVFFMILDYVTIAPYTTSVVAGRRLSVFRGSGAAASGGTGIPSAVRRLSTSPASSVDSVSGGDVRIATTGALTVTGITFESQEVACIHLVGAGAAGSVVRNTFEFGISQEPLMLRPGELIAVRNPVAMDAGGTWQLGVHVYFVEV